MAITTKKPKSQANEAEVQKLINKGGSVAALKPPSDEPEYTSVILRLPVDMLAEIDASNKKRLPVRMSRNSWIVESCHERLQREEKEEK